ncbi:hypothetical protein, partial [Falsiroseomonas sp. E2-1-a20]|uniref:hypothetical protein n=1 Tax=Falsiroseomonas sp. E2-1-a20 TaxID=3239300 RepID=UPI003F3C192F
QKPRNARDERATEVHAGCAAQAPIDRNMDCCPDRRLHLCNALVRCPFTRSVRREAYALDRPDHHRGVDRVFLAAAIEAMGLLMTDQQTNGRGPPASKSLKWEVCLHEAGHAVALCEIFRRHPDCIDAGAQRTELWSGQLEDLCDDRNAQRRAAYYAAGRAAERLAVVCRALPDDFNPEVGYGTSSCACSDATEVDKLTRQFVVDDEVAFASAARCVVDRWPDLLRLACALWARNVLDEGEIAEILPIRDAFETVSFKV